MLGRMSLSRALGLPSIVAALSLAGALPPVSAAEHRVVTLGLANGALAEGSDTVRLKQGDDVELRWSSDRAVTLHLHGYDIESKVLPGKPTLMSFKATLAGRFPVEVHGQAGHAHRPVVYLEVYP
jgi:hypothetical protein